MNKALSNDRQAQKRGGSPGKSLAGTGLDWRRKVSDHVAFGLLVYTGLHIFVTITAIKSEGGSILPYFALVVLVVAIIPACRWVELRWERLSDAEAADPRLRPVFVREMVMLWLAAIGLPVALTFAFKAIAALF